MPAKRPSQEAADDALVERLARAQTVLRVTVGGGTDLTFDAPLFENLPIAFRRRVKLVTGQGISDLGIDRLHQMVCLWWVSRFYAGEDVSLADVEEEWDERCKGVRLGDITTEMVNLAAKVDGVLSGESDEDLDPEA